MCSGDRTDIASAATALLAFVARLAVQLQRLAPDREGSWARPEIGARAAAL